MLTDSAIYNLRSKRKFSSQILYSKDWTSLDVKISTLLHMRSLSSAFCSVGVPLARNIPRGPGSKKIDLSTSIAYSRAEITRSGESSTKAKPSQNMIFDCLIAIFTPVVKVVIQLKAGSLIKSDGLIKKKEGM